MTFAYCISLNCIAIVLYSVDTRVRILGSWDILGYTGSAMVNCRLRLVKAAQCLQRSLELLGSGPTKAGAKVTRAVVECGRFFMQIHVHVQQICSTAKPKQFRNAYHKTF